MVLPLILANNLPGGGKGEGPDFVPVPQGRDVQGEQNILGTGGEFLEFLTGEGSRLGDALSNFDLPLQQLTGALQGEATGVLNPLISRGIEDSLGAQSSALGDIERFLARQTGGRAQFGGNRLLAQTTSDFARQRARVPLNVFTETIRNFLPLIGQKVQAESQIAQGALGGAQVFNRVSGGKAAQQQNLAIAGIPPETKDLSGFGQAAGTALALGVASSDRRLKTNINKIGRLYNGLNIYSFNYIWGGPDHVGVMSDEVRKIIPSAVTQIAGYDVVDYLQVLNG